MSAVYNRRSELKVLDGRKQNAVGTKSSVEIEMQHLDSENQEATYRLDDELT